MPCRRTNSSSGRRVRASVRGLLEWPHAGVDERPAARPTRAPRRSPVTDHGFTVGDGVFEAIKVVDGQPFALDPAPRAAGPIGRRARAAGARRRATYAAGVAAVLEGQDAAARADPDHLHRRPGAARLGPRRRRRRRWSWSPTPMEPWPDDDRGGDGAVAAQRARRARRPEDHVVRRERRRARRRRSERGASEAIFANLAGPPVRGHRHQRLLRRRRRAAHADAGERLPGRRDPGADPGVVRRRSRSTSRSRCVDAGRARCSWRRRRATCRRCRAGTTASCRRPGPVTAEALATWRRREPELLGR